MNGTLFHFLALWQPIGYLMLFLGMMLEGDAVLFLAALLVQQGTLQLFPAIVVAFLGVLMGDTGWYYLGHAVDQNNFFAKWIHRLAHPFDEHVIARPFRTIFISKFTYGFHHAILMRSGALKVPIRYFIKVDILASIAWLSIVGSIGYFSGASIIYLRHYVKFAEIAAAVLLLIYVIFEKTITAILRKFL